MVSVLGHVDRCLLSTDIADVEDAANLGTDDPVKGLGETSDVGRKSEHIEHEADNNHGNDVVEVVIEHQVEEAQSQDDHSAQGQVAEQQAAR